jgi:hypothetical protein
MTIVPIIFRDFFVAYNTQNNEEFAVKFVSATHFLSFLTFHCVGTNEDKVPIALLRSKII